MGENDRELGELTARQEDHGRRLDTAEKTLLGVMHVQNTNAVHLGLLSRIVYGMVAVILSTVVIALLALVIKAAG